MCWIRSDNTLGAIVQFIKKKFKNVGEVNEE